MVYFFWGLSHIEEKVPAADQDTFKEAGPGLLQAQLSCKLGPALSFL